MQMNVDCFFFVFVDKVPPNSPNPPATFGLPKLDFNFDSIMTPAPTQRYIDENQRDRVLEDLLDAMFNEPPKKDNDGDSWPATPTAPIEPIETTQDEQAGIFEAFNMLFDEINDELNEDISDLYDDADILPIITVESIEDVHPSTTSTADKLGWKSTTTRRPITTTNANANGVGIGNISPTIPTNSGLVSGGVKPKYFGQKAANPSISQSENRTFFLYVFFGFTSQKNILILCCFCFDCC